MYKNLFLIKKIESLSKFIVSLKHQKNFVKRMQQFKKN